MSAKGLEENPGLNIALESLSAKYTVLHVVGKCSAKFPVTIHILVYWSDWYACNTLHFVSAFEIQINAERRLNFVLS